MAYSFLDFRRDSQARVRLLNRRLSDSDAVWPGVLLLDVPHGLSAQAFELGTVHLTRYCANRRRNPVGGDDPAAVVYLDVFHEETE